jgi:hypothetical protein
MHSNKEFICRPNDIIHIEKRLAIMHKGVNKDILYDIFVAVVIADKDKPTHDDFINKGKINHKQSSAIKLSASVAPKVSDRKIVILRDKFFRSIFETIGTNTIVKTLNQRLIGQLVKLNTKINASTSSLTPKRKAIIISFAAPANLLTSI